MAIVFFVSSVGDTKLARATIDELIKQELKDHIFLIPITASAKDQTKE